MIRHSYGPRSWGLPGGGIDKGETPEAAAIREVREELGIQLNAVQPFTTAQEEVSSSPQTAFIFTAVSDQTPRPDKREIVDARFFGVDVDSGLHAVSPTIGVPFSLVNVLFPPLLLMATMLLLPLVISGARSEAIRACTIAWWSTWPGCCRCAWY